MVGRCCSGAENVGPAKSARRHAEPQLSLVENREVCVGFAREFPCPATHLGTLFAGADALRATLEPSQTASMALDPSYINDLAEREGLLLKSRGLHLARKAFQPA